MSERLFLALWPPAPVLDELAEALPPAPALRWQPRERWHLTVAFLGDRSAEQALRKLERVGADAEPLMLSGSGAFGPVLWVGVSAGAWLPGLARQARRVYGVDERHFRAHVTLARARDAVGHRELKRAQAGLAGFESSAWLPGELTLVRSTLGPQASYEVIGRKPLNGP